MKRNLHLDNIRGLLLVIMLIDHLHLHLSKLTNNTVGYISAAEGFIFVSGMVAGMVYIARAKKSNIKTIATQARNRSFTIYKFHILLYVLSLIIFLSFHSIDQYWRNTSPLFATDPTRALFLGVLFLYQPALNDILPIYSIFLLVIPLVIRELLKNRLNFVLFLSVSLYILAQMSVVELLTNWINKGFNQSIDLGYFNPLAWQILFLLGLVFGNYEINKNPRWQAFKRNRVTFFVMLFVLLVCFFLRHTLNKDLPYADFLINRSHLSPLRLLNFLALAFVVNYLISRYQPRIIVPFLTYLGQNSLQVFAFHVIISLCLTPFIPAIMKQGYVVELLVTILVISSLWIPAFLNELYKKKSALKLARS